MARTNYAPELAAEIQRRTAMLAGALAGAAETTDDAVRYRLTEDAEQIADKIARDAAEIAGGEYRPEYNGWPNRETWNTALWISNEQAWTETAADIVREQMRDPATDYPDNPETDRAVRIRNAADRLREWWDEENDAGPDAGPLADAWSYTVAVTDWYRIAEGIADELPAEEA